MNREIVIRIPNRFVANKFLAALRNATNQNVAEIIEIEDLIDLIQRATDESARGELRERID